MPRRSASMLATITCDRCRDETFGVRGPADVEGSFAELRNAGWMDMARRGLGEHRWPWTCPACRPGPPIATVHVAVPAAPGSYLHEREQRMRERAADDVARARGDVLDRWLDVADLDATERDYGPAADCSREEREM